MSQLVLWYETLHIYTREIFVLNFQIENTFFVNFYLLPHSFIDVEDPSVVDQLVVFVPPSGD